MDAKRMEELLLDHRLVAVLRTATTGEALLAGRAVLAGGARIVEVTLTVPGALEVLAALRAEAPAGAAIGVGTVLDAEALADALALGADFAISPDVNPEVMKAARDRGVLHLPGAMTPTEILHAARAGARVVKVFPIASLGGAAHVRALRGPIPRLPLLVSGGVDLGALDEFLDAGTSAVGLTTTLIEPAALAAGDAGRIAARTREWLAALARHPGQTARV